MSDLNRACLHGRLGRDPETRSLQNGDKVVSLRLATGESWKDKNTGEKKERTEWHSVVIFGPLAKVAESYLRKGSRCYLEGAIRTRKWQDQSGADRYSTEIVISGFGGRLDLLDSKPGGAGQGREDSYGDIMERDRERDGSADTGGGYDDRAGVGGADYDDEIPF